MVRGFLSIIGIFVLVCFIAALPKMIIVGGYYGIKFSPDPGWHTFKEYLQGLANGDSFLFKQGTDRVQNFLHVVNRYFLMSYFYLALASFFAVMVSTFLGIFQGKSNKGWIKDIIGFFGAIPDFMFILLMQLGVAMIYDSTGVRIAKVASSSTSDPAVLLPIITLTLVPAIYLIRTFSEHTYDQLSEDYILTAKSKGLGKLYILMRHSLRNVLPFLKADLHKVAAIMMGNLFIVEYLYNLRGITRLVFSRVGYQYDLVADCLIAFVILYFILYWTMRLFVLGLERIFAYD